MNVLHLHRLLRNANDVKVFFGERQGKRRPITFFFSLENELDIKHFRFFEVQT